MQDLKMRCVVDFDVAAAVVVVVHLRMVVGVVVMELLAAGIG